VYTIANNQSTTTTTTKIYREKHLEKKIDDLVLEAKAKIAKNDKKGKIFFRF
jgi:hypothetical protein